MPSLQSTVVEEAVIWYPDACQGRWADCCEGDQVEGDGLGVGWEEADLPASQKRMKFSIESDRPERVEFQRAGRILARDLQLLTLVQRGLHQPVTRRKFIEV